MIVSEYNFYVPTEILPLSKLMNPMNVVNAYFASLKIAFSAAVVIGERAVRSSPPHPFHSRYSPGWVIPALGSKDLPSCGAACVGGPGPSRALFCWCRCCIWSSGMSYDVVGACACVKDNRENRSNGWVFSIRAESALNWSRLGVVTSEVYCVFGQIFHLSFRGYS